MKLQSLFLAVIAIVGCSAKENPVPASDDVVTAALSAPTEVTVENIPRSTDLKVTWTDNSDGETGFSIIMMEPEVRVQTVLGTAPANDTSYIITSGLDFDRNYYIGVRADSDKEDCSSIVKWALFYYKDVSHYPCPVFDGEAESYPTSIAVKYHMENMGTAARKDWGVCWADHSEPTLDDNWCHGPKMSSNDTPVKQLIPNVTMNYGTTYYFRVYVKAEETYYYSDEITAQLGTEPEAITLNWKEESVSGLPASVKVYSTTDKLSGRNFNAWYAIADMSKGDVEFRTQTPSSIASVKNQFTSDCYALINGPYFSYSGGDYGRTVVNGRAKGGSYASRGSLRSDDPEYNIMYNCTKGIFGVDYNGKFSAVWGNTGADQGFHYFDSPLPTVKGWDKYDNTTDTYPFPALKWDPRYAATAGPVLVKNGKILVEPTVTQSGNEYFLTNWEVIAYDIFGGSSVHPDRTAAGVTADGSVILFVCDGRITASQGATIFEMAQIMKGLGCVDAVNFDGGGSTALVVAGGKQMNYTNGGDDGSRTVWTTMGFFKK